MIRRTPLRRTRMRRAPAPSRPEMAGARESVYERAGHRCELCARRLTLVSMHAHHRLTRRHGEDCACNLLCLCGDCHTAAAWAVHRQVAVSREAGRILSRHDTRPASGVPVLLAAGEVLLTCDGRYISLGGLDSGMSRVFDGPTEQPAEGSGK